MEIVCEDCGELLDEEDLTYEGDRLVCYSCAMNYDDPMNDFDYEDEPNN